jgi:CarD family transcriptional regulator
VASPYQSFYRAGFFIFVFWLSREREFMEYKIGDKVIHSTFGFSEIIDVEEKEISGVMERYYVVKVNKMVIWIPVINLKNATLRLPSTKNSFNDLFSILRSKYSPLSNDKKVRKSQIHFQINEGNSESICRLVRDLSFYKSSKKLNEDENSILRRAIRIIIDEWQFSLETSQNQANADLNTLLAESYSNSLVQ